MNFYNLLKKNGIIFSSGLMLALVIANVGFIFYNNHILEKNTALKAETETIKRINTDIWNEMVRNLDIGTRGYAVTRDTSLLKPYYEALARHAVLFSELRLLLEKQGYDDLQGLAEVDKEVTKYEQSSAFINDLIKENLLDSVAAEIKKDKGKNLWLAYDKFTTRLYAYEDSLNNQAEAEYSSAMKRTIYVQLLLAILGVPSLIFIIYKIRSDAKQRIQLFLELEKNNREYLFDPGTPLEVTNEKELINNSIVNFKTAASFINQISKGDYKVDWKELNEANSKLNQTNLAGELVQMREKMKQFKMEDEKRLWATEGIAQLSEIIRTNQHNLDLLCEKLVGFVVKYLGAQQGSLFLLREDENEQYLQLAACFAFDRKKFIEKRIEIGEGLVGQTFLEKQSNILSKLPPDYLSITSGLGETSPACLILAPMKYNEKVEAVVEIASFTKFEPYQIEWLDKIGEITASTLVSVKVAEKTQGLLEQFKQQTEQLRAQEEELRQNLEEMEATQEEMRRKEIELENRQREMTKNSDSK